MPSIGINDFVRRQTPSSEFTHFESPSGEDPWATIAALAVTHFSAAKPGYRDGVVLVPVPAVGFYTGMTILEEGDRLVGEYRARRPGEEPRKEVRVFRKDGKKSPCVAVDIVLYRRDVLAENSENTTDCDWEIVSVNGRITEEEAPIAPMTLLANHFELSGGTSTKMSPEALVEALRRSVLYWKDKALLDV